MKACALTGRKVRRPELTLAVADHNVPTKDRDKGITDPESREQVADPGKEHQGFRHRIFCRWTISAPGIVHIIGPEQGWTLPGTTIVCGDSHTSTHGAFGALAFGIGTSDVEHVLATQTLLMPKSKNMRVTVNGKLPEGVTAKDIALAVIAKIGTAGGTGYVIEYAGEAVRALSMEGRMTLCNLTIEGGARAGLIAVDDTTINYIKGRPRAPKGGGVRSGGALLAHPEVRSRRQVRCRNHAGCARHRADGDLGHLAGTGAADHRQCARSRRKMEEHQARRRRTRARLYGPDRPA